MIHRSNGIHHHWMGFRNHAPPSTNPRPPRRARDQRVPKKKNDPRPSPLGDVLQIGGSRESMLSAGPAISISVGVPESVVPTLSKRRRYADTALGDENASGGIVDVGNWEPMRTRRGTHSPPPERTPSRPSKISRTSLPAPSKIGRDATPVLTVRSTNLGFPAAAAGKNTRTELGKVGNTMQSTSSQYHGPRSPSPPSVSSWLSADAVGPVLSAKPSCVADAAIALATPHHQNDRAPLDPVAHEDSSPEAAHLASQLQEVGHFSDISLSKLTLTLTCPHRRRTVDMILEDPKKFEYVWMP